MASLYNIIGTFCDMKGKKNSIIYCRSDAISLFDAIENSYNHFLCSDFPYILSKH
jgi:hypothetical protein